MKYEEEKNMKIKQKIFRKLILSRTIVNIVKNNFGKQTALQNMEHNRNIQYI